MSKSQADAVQETEASTAETGAAPNVQEPEPEFQPGDVVVISETFHSAYFRGLTGVIDGKSRKGGSGQTLWPLKIDVPPHRTLIPAKYLRLKEAAGAAGSQSSSKGSFFSRLFARTR